MARGEKRVQQPLPAPLPPAERTVGQLVGEAVRRFTADFWRCLALGVPVVASNAVVWSADARLAVTPVAALLVSMGYVGAISLVYGVALRTRQALVAYLLAVVLFLPFPLLVSLYVLPGIAWLALVGLSVPAAMVERLGVRDALIRGYRLARVDFVHVLGGLATLALVVLISQFTLYFVLREFAENTRLAAAALAALVVSPIVFLGSAILYEDQRARLERRSE